MSDTWSFKVLREGEIAGAARAAGRLIPPPYHTYDVDLVYLVCRFDRAVARSALPSQLDPTDEGLGVVMFVNARRGWVVAPFTACVATLQVKGFDGPDQYPAGYVHTAFYSGVCGEVFGQVYNDALTNGFAKVWMDGDRVLGSAGRDGADTATFSGRATGNVTDEVVGMNRYLSRLGDTIQAYTTTYSCRYGELVDVSLEIFDTAPEPLRRLKPLEIVSSFWLAGMQLTFNPATALGTAAATAPADAALAALFDLVTRFKRPAAIIGESGRPLFVTPEAMELLGDGGSLVLSPRLLMGKAGLDRGGALGDPILLDQGNGRPLLAQVLPIAEAVGPEQLRLVLLTDPKGSGRGEPEPILRLLGLTPAEARLASRVGRGASPQEAGPELGMTASTARSMLKTVYAKLEVSRQSQLAQLVTRLEAV